MTVRELYDAALIESNKVKAPSLLTDDYVYFLNKAVQQYVNQVYNRCEYNQQSSDDLSFLHTTDVINLEYDSDKQVSCGALPEDYLHLLNCIGEFQLNDITNKKPWCGNSEVTTRNKRQMCQRLTADLKAGVVDNYYMKPSAKKPYYYIITKDDKLSIEIYAGKTPCNSIEIAYIKCPAKLSLTEDDVYAEIDETSKVEFPDYVCYEIINIFTRLLLENASDPRLQTNIPINQTIGISATK